MWMTIKNLAEHLGVSAKTIRRRLAKGEWDKKVSKEGSGSPTTYLFYPISKMDKPAKVDTSKLDTSKLDTSKLDTSKLDTSKVDTSKVNNSKGHQNDDLKLNKSKNANINLTGQAQTGCYPHRAKAQKAGADLSPAPALLNSEEPEKVDMTTSNNDISDNEDRNNNLTGQVERKAQLQQTGCYPHRAKAQQAGADLSPAPALLDSDTIKELQIAASRDEKSEDLLPKKYENEAQLKALLCDKIMKALANKQTKKFSWKLINDAYNEGHLVPELLAIKGEQSIRTIQRWLKTYKENDRDYMSLAPGYVVKERGRSVTPKEQNFLLKELLDPNRVKIGSAIRKLKQFKRANLIKSETSETTLRRWVEDYKRNNIEIWTLKREGEKYFEEHINMTILRDSSKLKVGDIWVTDGHVLAFDIIDRYTGKPKRMTMIMYFDWASRMPVGISLSPTENSENIKLAFRNGCLNAGYAPLFLLQDNGRAFRSKVFHGKWEDHDLETELGGIYSRVGTNVSFAKAYNAKSKVIERFFLTFQEGFERYIDTFRGSKIGDKPADLSRNEKWSKSFKERKPLTMDEAMMLIDFYIMDLYAKTPHRGLKGKTPLEVWKAAEIEESRLIDPEKLNHMMLTREIKKITNNGINFTTLLYHNNKLIKYVGQPCIIKYDFRDIKMIKVYDMKNRFICDAYTRTKTNPMVRLNGTELDKEHLDRDLKQIKANTKKAKELATKETLRIEQATSDFLTVDYDRKPTTFSNGLMLNIPKAVESKTLDEITAETIKENNRKEENDKTKNNSNKADDSKKADESDNQKAKEFSLVIRKKKEPKEVETANFPSLEEMGFKL